MEQLGYHRTHFDEVWYWSIFRKSVGKVQVLLKYDKNRGLGGGGALREGVYIYNNIWLYSSCYEKCFIEIA
jgi:hypothetical protein